MRAKASSSGTRSTPATTMRTSGWRAAGTAEWRQNRRRKPARSLTAIPCRGLRVVVRRGLQRLKNLFDLAGRLLERAVSANHEVGAGDLLRGRPLGGQPLRRLLVGEA